MRKRALSAVTCALVITLSSACARITDEPSDADGGSGRTPPASDRADAAASGEASEADAQANADAAVCELPPSICIDDHTLRYWRPRLENDPRPIWDGGDGGACTFVYIDVPCEPSPAGPACRNGGCYQIALR